MKILLLVELLLSIFGGLLELLRPNLVKHLLMSFDLLRVDSFLLCDLLYCLLVPHCLFLSELLFSFEVEGLDFAHLSIVLCVFLPELESVKSINLLLLLFILNALNLFIVETFAHFVKLLGLLFLPRIHLTYNAYLTFPLIFLPLSFLTV